MNFNIYLHNKTPYFMITKDEAEELFKKLQQEYQSPYFPSKEEKELAIMALTRIVRKKHSDEFLLGKIRILREVHGNMKTKVTNLIMNEFWLQKLDYGVKARKFKDED